MGLADTIRETFGGGSAATHEGQSSEASRGVVDSHTPGAFPADTPIAEEQRELGGSQSNTAGNVLAGKEGLRGHEHKDSGVGLSDVTGGGHPKTVGHTDPLHSSTSTTGGNTNTSTLSDVTHSHPQTVDRSALSHNTSAAANTPTSTGLSDVTHSRPQTVEKGALHQSPLEQGTLQSHPRTTGHSDVTPTTGGHFRRSSVDMPKDSTSRGPSEGIDSHHKNDPSTLGGLLGGNYLGGASHKHEKSPLDKDSHLTGDTAGGLLSSEPYNRNTATQGTADRSPLGHDTTSSNASTLGGTDAPHNIVSNEKNKTHTDNKETYWGDLPTAESLPSAGIYNTVTGSGSGEDHSAQHRRVPAAGDSEVAMQSAGHGAEAHVPRGGVYNTVVGHGSSADDTVGRTPEHNRSGSGSGIYNALSGGYNVAANAAQGLYNTVSGRSASGTEHQYEHEKPLTTSTSASNTTGTGSAVLDPTGTKHQYEHESPFSTTTPSSRAVQSETTPSSTGNNQGVAAGAYNTLASAAQGVSNTVTGNNNTHNTTTGTTGTQHERSAPLTGTSTTGSYNTTTGTNEPGVAEKTYDALASAAQGVSNTVTGKNNTHTTGNQYERDTPLAGATSRNTTTNTSGSQPGYAAGAYNAVANTAQSVSDTVTGNNRTTGYEQGGPYDSTSSSRSNLTGTTGTEHHQPGQLHTGNTTGTHRAFPLDNSSPTLTTTNRSAGSDLNPATTTTGTTGTTHDHHSHTGRNLAGAGVGAAAGAGAYDFLHRKENDKPDPQNEFVSNVNPYNAPQHEGWQHSDSAGLFSDSELKRLSLRQKDGSHNEISAPSHGESHNLSTSGPGQTHGFHGMSSHPTSSSTSGPGYDTPESLTAAGSRSSQTRGDDFHGTGQTHGLGSGHPSAHKSEIPIPSRVHESPSSLAAQRAEPPHSSDHSNVGAGLAGAGLGAGAGYGASRLARDHHDDKHSGTASGIPTSTSSRQQQPVESSTLNRTAESPSSLAAQRAEPPRSSDHSNVGTGLAGAGLGAGAGYGASRLAHDHHDDKHSSTASGIPTSTSSRQQEPVESSTLNRPAEPTTSSHHKDHHKDDDSTGHHHSILPLPTHKHHDKNDRPDRSADDLGNTTSASGLHHDDTEPHQHGHHKARDVAAFGAGAGAGAGAYEAVSHSRRESEPKGVRQPGQSAANISSPPTTMSSIAQERRTGHSPIAPTSATSTTSPTSTLDMHQKERAAAGMTGISPSSNVGSGVTGAGVGAGAGAGAVAASGMSQQGLPQQQQQNTLSRSGADGHAPLHSTIDEHVKERGTTVPSSAHAGKKDPYNHLSSGTPSGVSLE